MSRKLGRVTVWAVANLVNCTAAGDPLPVISTSIWQDSSKRKCMPTDRIGFYGNSRKEWRIVIRKYRVDFPVFLALLLVGGLATVSVASATTLVHMTYAWHGDAWHAFLNQMAEEFEQLHPGVSVEILIQGSTGDYLDKLRVMTMAGTPPDVLDLASGYGNLAVEGLFLDLKPYLEKEDPALQEAILGNALELYSVDDMLWGMPNSLFMVVSWFNEDHLNEVGLLLPTQMDPSEWNWETLRDYARKLTIDRNNDGEVDQWGLDRQSAAWLQLVASNGGYMYNKRILPTESQWTNQRVVDAIEFNRQLLQDDKVASVRWDSSKHFWVGGSSMAIVDGPGRLPSLKDAPFDWDIYLLPAGPEGCNCGAISADGFQINAFTENPDLAWEWVKFLTLRPESVAAFAVQTGRFPALAGVHEMYPTINPDAPKNWRAFVEAAAQPGVYMAPVLPADHILSIQNHYLDQIWNGQMPTRNALEQMDRLIQNILNQSY